MSRYDLELEYKLAGHRLSGTATITAITLASLQAFTSTSPTTCRSSRSPSTGNGRRSTAIPPEASDPAAECAAGRIGDDDRGALRGAPRPIRSLWGEVGFEELTDGILVAGQPNGSPSWFPCDDHPSAKASYRIAISTDSPYFAVANGELVSKRARAGQTQWIYEQPEPTSTYLATLQIGRYEVHQLTKTPVRMQAVLPNRLRANFNHDFARQQQMMKLFIKLFGPYLLAAGYTVVVTDDELEIPLEAQGVSIFGANHCDGRRGSERLIAHELAHQWFGNSVTARRWRDVGYTRDSPVTQSGCGRRTPADRAQPNTPCSTVSG